MVTVRFEKNSNAEFVGEECVAQYEAYIRAELEKEFGEVELTNDSPMGTKIEGDFDSPDSEQDAADIVHLVLTKAGNNLASIYT